MSTDIEKAAGPGAVVPAEEWAQMASAFDDGISDYIASQGLTMPRLRSDFGKGGKGWIDDLTGAAFDELSVVFLAMPPSRAWWEKSIDEGGGGAPDCASRVNFKARKPDDNSVMRQSDSCTDCTHAQWGANDEKPTCAESVNVLAYSPADDQFFWLRFAGTALKPLRNYVSALVARKRPPFSVLTHVTLDSATRDKLQWFVPHFAIKEELTPADVAPYRDVAEKAMQMWTSVADEMAGAAAPTGAFVDDKGDEFSEDAF